MQVQCPSCSTKYQTEDYKNEFEILCSCGYSILVPDESAIHREVQAAEEEKAGLDIPMNMVEPTQSGIEEIPVFSSDPASMDAEDIVIAIPGFDLQNPPSDMPEIVFENEVVFTPSEQLPKEMPYDPYEIPDPNAAPVPVPIEIQNANPKTNSRPSTEAQVLSPGLAKASRVQILIQKSVRSSLGQILGYSYNLKIEGLAEPDLNHLKTHVSQFCHFRPWLDDEVKKRNILLDHLKLNEWIENIPEPLALEIYLKSMELGGNCDFLLAS